MVDEQHKIVELRVEGVTLVTVEGVLVREELDVVLDVAS